MPIGRQIATTAKEVSRAFGETLAAAGGSEHVWLILLALKTRENANQRALAAAVGIQGATLTHHLNAMEDGGLVTRRRDPQNRRIHVVELTSDGEASFLRMRSAAVEFDKRLRGDLTDDELEHVADVLDRLRANVACG
jgi:MarR family transcriptional regulator, transcriptional regulator for hemolysin